MITATKRSSAFTEPPPSMDVNDPRWPDAFAAWAERKAKHFGMDAMEMMGRALGCNMKADSWRKKRQAALRHQEQHANDIYGKTPTKRKCPHCGSTTHPPGCCAQDGHGG